MVIEDELNEPEMKGKTQERVPQKTTTSQEMMLLKAKTQKEPWKAARMQSWWAFPNSWHGMNFPYCSD
jgi:hypothetical protein